MFVVDVYLCQKFVCSIFDRALQVLEVVEKGRLHSEKYSSYWDLQNVLSIPGPSSIIFWVNACIFQTLKVS